MPPKRLHVWRWRAVTVWIVIFTVVVIWAVRDGIQAKHAICALKRDHQRQLVRSEEFLRNHPNGIFGITPQQIRADIEDARMTIRALRIKC